MGGTYAESQLQVQQMSHMSLNSDPATAQSLNRQEAKYTGKERAHHMKRTRQQNSPLPKIKIDIAMCFTLKDVVPFLDTSLKIGRFLGQYIWGRGGGGRYSS